MSGKINVIAAVGLALGGALGMAGAMVTQQKVQAILWAIDGAGLVMATPLLAIKYFRMGNDIVAGGFLVFAIGEGIILLSGPAAGLAGSIPAFAAGSALWGTALLLISIPKLFAAPVRLLGIVSAVLFIITSARIFWGEATTADIDAAADLCLSPACSDLCWLDLDAFARAGLNLSPANAPRPRRRGDRLRPPATSVNGRFCCKSRKLNDAENLANVDFCATPPLQYFVAPIRSSVAVFARNDVVPPIAARETHQRS
jgi:hypothetical protein